MRQNFQVVEFVCVTSEIFRPNVATIYVGPLKTRGVNSKELGIIQFDVFWIRHFLYVYGDVILAGCRSVYVNIT
jgi:hypothetical protein